MLGKGLGDHGTWGVHRVGPIKGRARCTHPTIIVNTSTTRRQRGCLPEQLAVKTARARLIYTDNRGVATTGKHLEEQRTYVLWSISR